MALSAPRTVFGLHSASFYNRSTGVPYGILKVLESSSLSLEGELIDLMGGSSKYAWASEDGNITAEVKLAFSQYEDFVYELFLGKAPTPVAADTTGDVSTLTNKYGTSFVNATTGIASVAITSSDNADLKFGKYLCKATTDDDFTIYNYSDIDFGRGTNAVYTDDTLAIATVAMGDTSATAAVAELGITFTGGSGTVALTVGDTAVFEILPVHGGAMTVKIGSVADTSFPEFGMIVYGQKRGNGEMMEIDIFRCKAAGMPLNFQRNTWASAEVTIKALYDSTEDAVFEVRHVEPS